MTERIMLRNDDKMIRDFWFESDIQSDEGPILCVRQIKIQDAEAVIKIIRFTKPEWMVILAEMQEH